MLREGGQKVFAPALSAVWTDETEFPEARLHEDYAAYELWMDGEMVSSGTALFCRAEAFCVCRSASDRGAGGRKADRAREGYARSVEIVCDDGDCLFSDNYFDMNGGEKTVSILRGSGDKFRVRSVYDIR